MKRLILLILSACFLLSCTACAPVEADTTAFYYLRTADTIAYGDPDALIAPTAVDISPETPLDDALRLYLDGPGVENLVTPFPMGTYLLSTIVREDMIVLVLSREFSSLDGIALTLAGACLTATCHELTGMERIQVRSDENTYDFDLNDFVFLDDSAGK